MIAAIILAATIVAVAALTTAAIRALFDQPPACTGPAAGHPERVRQLPDPDEDAAYWISAEWLLYDQKPPRLADVVEGLEWR
ncbi:hypothetical protein [Actinomadura litoris]|uniref:hypothetical protein n=1 Tax=Actinomadura litoris TaxID=2678616 RepID=UPI001FA80045|nr:hypothetical protein [Actinomadura litoris]